MGSLFSSKTKSKSTSSTQVPQNYQNFINMSLAKADAAGNQGFTRYDGPRIAELSGNEQAGINAAGSQAGMYQPVVNMAMQSSQDLMNNAFPDANQYINPYVNYVLGNSLDRLQEQSDTNMTKIGSQAAMSSAFGGLRHGVLEGANLGELLKSARDLSATTYSDAYDKGMNTWFRAQDNQRANVGSAIQNVRGAQDYNQNDVRNLMSTGLTERTRNQAGLDFGYSEFMREDQDDLNKASFLSTIAAQYPRDLFTKTNVTETTQSDSPIKTLAGIGLAAAGIMSGNPAAAAGLGAGKQALGGGYSDAAYQAYGVLTGGRAKGGLIKKYANGGMVKAGLGMMAGMDPLEAVTEHLNQAKEDNTDFGLGGFLAGGWLLGKAEDRMKRRKPVQEEQARIQPVAQRQPFDWDTFLRNMNFSSFTRPSQNTVNPSYGAPSSMPQFNQTYTPMSQQRVPLNPGIPGPGGPQSLQGNTLQRPVNQDPVNQPLSVYAKGGKVKKDPFDAISPEALKEVADSWTLGNTSYYTHTAPNREEYLRRLEANKQYAQRRLGQYELGDLRNFSGNTAADGNASQEEYIRQALRYQNRIDAESAPGPKDSMAMIRDGAREDFAGPVDKQRRDEVLSDALSAMEPEDLKKYLDYIGKHGSSTEGLWDALEGSKYDSGKYGYYDAGPQKIISMLTRWKEKDRKYTNPSKYAAGGFVSPQRKAPSKSATQLDPQTLDILGKLLQQQPPKFGDSEAARRQYNQHQFGNAGNPNPPMPDWMQDPEMIRMMQETFGNSSVPQFDSFQDVIDGKQSVSGYAKGGKVKSPAWQRKEGKNPEGGLNAKGRASYNRANPGKPGLKAPQPEGGSRRDSFCARMSGMKKKLTSKKTANDPDSRINKSLRAWNCHAEGGLIDGLRAWGNDRDMGMVKAGLSMAGGADPLEAMDGYNQHLRLLKGNYAGGGKIGPGVAGGLPEVASDDSNWLAIQGILGMFDPEPVTAFESNTTDMDEDRAEQLARRSINEIRRSIPFAKAKKKQEHAAKEAAMDNYDFGPSIGNRTPLDAMVADMLSEPQPAMQPLRVGKDGFLADPVNEADTRAVMNHLRAVQALDPNSPFPEFSKNNKIPPVERFTAEDDMENFRKKYPNVTPLIDKYIPYPYNPEGKREYAAGGKVMKFQEGGPTFVQGGKSFEKNQARVPAEMVDPLAAIYYGMDSSAGKFQPDFKNLGRDDVLGDVMGEGTITKAQARNQVPQFDSMRDVIDSLPMDPNADTTRVMPRFVPQRYSNSKMWDDVNEDLFLEGTKMNEQDNRIKNKLLSTNPDTQAFSQYQFVPKTWNEAITRIDPETRKRLNINPVSASEIKKYASGDDRLASILPSQEAVDYVYKTDYLPQSYNNLKKANVPITELNLYLAHHLGYNGAPNAIPVLYDEKNKDIPMKDLLYKAGLKSAATRKGNPWSYDKNPKLTFGQYRKMKEKAYEDLREKYRGQTLEEMTAEKGPPSQDAFDRRTINGGTTTFNPIKIIGDSYTKGGMGFNKGGQVKKFAGGGRTGPKSTQVLTMPENPTEYEPTWYEKFIERIHSPEGPFGKADDVLYDNGLNFYPSNSGKRPAHQVVLPIDERGWDYKPNPNLYSDPLGEWGNPGDPVDNFYNEMSDMIGQPSGGQPMLDEGAGGPGGGGGGAGGVPEVDEVDPEFEMLRELYANQLKEYKDAQTKPKKGAVFGMFDDVNEPLLKLGLSILASKGSFGEALGEAGLSSLADRDKKQMEKSQEASAKLQEILKLRYTNAMIESMDPRIKQELARQAQAAKLEERKYQIGFAREQAGITAKETRINEVLKAIMKWQSDNEGKPVPQEWLDIANAAGYKFSNPEDAGTSLFD